MANDYFTSTDLTANTKAKAEDINTRTESIESGFDKLPDPHASAPTTKGFSETFAIEDATARDEPAAAGQIQDQDLVYAAATGTDTYVVTLAPAVTTLVAGQLVVMKAAANNTGASTLNVNGIGATDIKTTTGGALTADSIVAGGIYILMYDGTDFQLVTRTEISSGTLADYIKKDGTVAFTGNQSLGSNNLTNGGTITATSFVGDVTGTVQTAAQPNITSVGTLTGVTCSGDITADTVYPSTSSSQPLRAYRSSAAGNSKLLTLESDFYTANYEHYIFYGSGAMRADYDGGVNDPFWDLRSDSAGGAFITVMQMQGDGDLYNTNGTYGSLSDEKLKENISDGTPKLQDLLKIKIRNFNFKESKAKEKKKLLGVVAQEVETVFPGLVGEITNEETGEKTKTVKTSLFIPMLVKAVQELENLVRKNKTTNSSQKLKIEKLERQNEDLLKRIVALEERGR